MISLSSIPSFIIVMEKIADKWGMLNNVLIYSEFLKRREDRK